MNFKLLKVDDCVYIIVISIGVAKQKNYIPI